MIDTDKYEGHMQDYYFEGSNFKLEYLTMFDGDDNAIAMLHSYDKKLMGGAAFLSPTIELMIGAPKLLAEVKRLRAVMIYVEQRQPHPALEWALKEGLTLTDIRERIE